MVQRMLGLAFIGFLSAAASDLLYFRVLKPFRDSRMT